MDGTDAERAKLRAELMTECEAMVDEAIAAMDKAPANNIIGGSEWGVQDAVMKAKQRIFERLVQSRIQIKDSQTGKSFSPSGQRGGAGQGQETPKQR